MRTRTVPGLLLALSAVVAAGCSTAAVHRPVGAAGSAVNRPVSQVGWRPVAGTGEVVVSIATFDTAPTADRTSEITSDSKFTSRPGPAIDSHTVEPRLSFADDWDRLPAEFFADVHSAYRHENLWLLLAAGGASFAIHKTVDDDVEDFYNEHPNRWDKGQEFFAAIGNPGHHFAAIAGMYAWSLHTQDAETHDLSLALFNAVSITGLSTMFLKATVGANTESPNGQVDPFGGAWPSGHTSSSFAIAAVLDEYYGHRVGIPAYMLAGLVGWERIDDGEHDLSDVVFGAVLGYVIGKTVACDHRVRFCGMELQPHVDAATGATGVAFERRF